jgi:hypothetical protein
MEPKSNINTVKKPTFFQWHELTPEEKQGLVESQNKENIHGTFWNILTYLSPLPPIYVFLSWIGLYKVNNNQIWPEAEEIEAEISPSYKEGLGSL